MKTIKTPLVAFAGMVLLGSALSAATTSWTGTTNSDFGTVTNWGAGLPGTDAATIDNGDEVDLSTNYATSIDQLIVGGNSILNASADFTAELLTIEDTGTVNLTDGAFTLPGAQNGSGLFIKNGGTLNISGGTHTINQRTVNNGTFQVEGSGSIIGLNQMTIHGGGEGVYDFIFDSGGIKTIKGVSGFAWFSIASATVSVDASAVAGIVGSYTLFDSHAAGSMFTSDKVTVDPSLGVEGVDWNLVITENVNGSGLRDTVVLNVVPEPSSYALLGGLLALSHVMLRRRRA
jgi:hypothetical protein